MWNHGQAIGEPIASTGHPTRYLFTDEYSWLIGNHREDVDLLLTTPSFNAIRESNHYHFGAGADCIREIFNQNSPSVLLFININPLADKAIMHFARKANPDVRVIYFLHEPFTNDKLVYGVRRALLLTLFELVIYWIVNRTDGIILPSWNAAEAFSHRYRKKFHGETCIIALPFIDKACTKVQKRKYITFVGHVRHKHQKGVDYFIEMIEESAKRQDEKLFQLVSSNRVDDLYASLSPAAQKRLHIVNSERLTDEEISKSLRDSIAVVLLQRRVMQSGVLPMAYMNGTPVIVSDLPGFTQFGEHEKTGIVLSLESSLEERFNSVEKIHRNIDKMSVACRRYYEDTFDSRQVRMHVDWIIGNY